MILDDTWVSVEAVSDDDIPLLVRYRPNLSNFLKPVFTCSGWM
ncbi:hypothetical protein ACRQ5D_30145 [Mucilaginibacter sp. P25]